MAIVEGFTQSSGSIPMPHRPEAEVCVLGSVMKSPDMALPVAMGMLVAEDFYVPAHQRVWSVLVEMSIDGADVDAMTLAAELSKRGHDRELGNATKLVADIYSSVPSHHHVRSYARMVLEDSHRRQVILGAAELQKGALDATRDIADVLDEVEGNLGRLRETVARAEIVPAKSLVATALDEIEEAQANRGKVRGIPTGFVDLDRMTGGLRERTLTILAARPSQGKSSLLGALLEHAAIEAGVPTLLFSLEDEGVALIKRMLARRGSVQLYRMKDGFLAKSDFPRLAESADAISKSPLFVDESAELTIQDLRARARMMVRRHRIQLIGVDYLQLLKGSSRQARDNRALEVAEVASGLKAMAKELGVAVVAAAQLGRGADDYERPKMSHLRESGGIENAADIIGLLVRPGKKKKELEDDHAILEIAKQRDGATGEVRLLWDGSMTKFENERNHDGSEKRLYG